VNAESFLCGRFRVGELQLTLPGGERLMFGDGAEPKVAVAIADHTTVLRILRRPTLGVGESSLPVL